MPIYKILGQNSKNIFCFFWCCCYNVVVVVVAVVVVGIGIRDKG